MVEQLQSLMKALEAGSYNASPGTLSQGSALQIENLSPIMNNVTYTDKHLKLQKSLSKEDCKATMAQFDRQLSYGVFGSSAQNEGGIGLESTSDYVRAIVPMAYYSETRRTFLTANMVNTVDGQKGESRQSKDAAIKIAGDIEFDCFLGQSHFSNAGVFDGNPLATANLPNMVGLDQQVRQSDGQANTQDLMFSEFGSSQSVVIPANGPLTQSLVEDLTVRSAMNLGSADKFFADPIVLAVYNKIAFAKERIILSGSPQEGTGSNLRQQWTSNSLVSMESSRFLSGITNPARPRASAPANPAVPVLTDTGPANSLLTAGSYVYYVTSANANGESQASPSATVAVALDGDAVTVAITNVSTASFYNVYRSNVGGSASGAFFIGRIKTASGATTTFTDLGNRSPGFVTGYLVETDGFKMYELSSYSELKLGIDSLSIPTAFFQFTCLGAMQPRKSVICDNLDGQQPTT